MLATKSEKRIVNILQLLGDGTRFKIFKLLAVRSDMCVSEIASLLRVSPSAISQHFKQFEMLGLVEKRRYGQKICYELTHDDAIVNNLTQLVTKGEY